MIKLTLTLATGTSYSRTVKRIPRYWMSLLMSDAPYGTNYRGATWTRERI
jgi:hypothetical protein